LTKLLFILAMILLTFSFAAARNKENAPLDVVPAVDLSRYTGKWYEIARLPNRFQKDCAGEVAATYTLLEDNQLKVVNECRESNGQLKKAEGKARLAKTGGPTSKLKVRFAPAWLSWLPSVWGDYWVIDLAPDYSYSVIGTPDRKYFWVLSRTPRMDEAVYQKIAERAAAKGFDIGQVKKTRQAE
jgi:apolipoprotein D and lipocalin family protein